MCSGFMVMVILRKNVVNNYLDPEGVHMKLFTFHLS